MATSFVAAVKEVGSPSRWRPELALWALPPMVYLLARWAPTGQLRWAISATIALGIAVVVSRRPVAGLVFLATWLVAQLSVLAFLYGHGVPVAVVRPMGALKDVVLLGLLLAAVTAFRAAHRRLDALDGLALGYLAIVTAYLVLPGLASGTSEDLSVRFLAWRTDVAYVLLFLAVRHLRLDAAARKRVLRAVLVAGVVVGGIAAYEALFSSAWNTFAVDVLGVQRYKVEVLDSPPPDLFDVRYHDVVGDREITRAGSVLFSPLTVAFLLVVAYAVGMAVLLRRHATTWTYVAVGVMASGALVTFTRAGIIGLLLVPLVALRISPGTLETVRVRASAALLCGALLVTPFMLESGLGARFAGQDDGSTDNHTQTFGDGVERLVDQPMGSGLGSAPGVGDRFQVEGKLTSHNSYLQVGNELGVLALVVFVALFVVLVRRCFAAARADPAPAAAVAAGAAGVALGVAGLAQHVWTEVPVALLFWSLAGLAVGGAEAARHARSRTGTA